MRQGEILGLSWDAIDFAAGTIHIKQQLAREKQRGGNYYLDTPKHDKQRTIHVAPLVLKKLHQRKAQQSADQLLAGEVWDNPWNLVFTNELGHHLSPSTVRQNFKRIVADMGMPDLRFHDMRHSFAVLSIIGGDDIKTVQGNLGHHTAAFTMDTYAHYTERMKEESAKRMNNLIQAIENV